MIRSLRSCLGAIALGLFLNASSAQAQHGHLNAGAVGTAQNDALTFANGNIFATSSGYVKDLTLQTTGNQAGYYDGAITLTSLAQTVVNGGPVEGAPALGSFIQVKITSVEGPANSSFAFWEDDSTSPTYSLKSGSGQSSALWDLSDASLGAGKVGADPFGHLHGRHFTADTEGLYTVGFQLFDTSVNGLGGGPIHTPSDVLYINFRAVPEPSAFALLGLSSAAFTGWMIRRRNA